MRNYVWLSALLYCALYPATISAAVGLDVIYVMGGPLAVARVILQQMEGIAIPMDLLATFSLAQVGPYRVPK